MVNDAIHQSGAAFEAAPLPEPVPVLTAAARLPDGYIVFTPQAAEGYHPSHTILR